MKRFVFTLFILVLLISLAACGAPASSPEGSTTPSATQSTTPSATPEPQETVVFADPVLEAMVRGAMGKPEGAITAADAAAVTRLDVSFDWQQYGSEATPIKDISGLEHFRNLESLDLSLLAITDITPLASLTKLIVLALGGNPVADLAPLAGLTSLKMLILTDCAAQDYSLLAQLINLELLMLDNATITDAAPLASLTNLKRLYLEGCELDYSPLADIYPNLEDSDFVILPTPTTLVELGFCMDGENKQAVYDNDWVSVRINHIEWGDPGAEMWGQNCVRTVFGTDEYKVDIGYYPMHDTYVVLANKDGEWAVNYLYHPSDGSFSFGLGDRESSERHIRAIFPDADDEDMLLEPVVFHSTALEDALGMTATALFELPYSPPSLTSLGFVESEEVRGYLYVHHEAGDYFDVSIHDPEQEAWEGGGEVRFFTPLSEEYRIVVTYHLNEKRFTVGADDNDGGGAEYRFFLGSDEHIDIWCSDDRLTVEQYFMKAINDPSITDASDVYQYSVKRMVLAVEETFGMEIDELCALPER